MARSPRAAITNHPDAQEAADECLRAGGTAVDAALAGYFALAGATTWALLSPVTVLVAGGGAGVRFVDGRARQPGQGIERPLRYADAGSPPLLALASAPATAAALSQTASQFGRDTLVRLAAYGVRAARKQGARARAALIERVGSAKSWALQDRSFLAEVAERVPRFEGALLQPSDLAIEAVDVAQGEPSTLLAGHPLALPPWHDPTAHPAGTALVLTTERGGMAGLLAMRPARTIALFDGEVDLPALAAPAIKGVPRLRPGSPLPVAAPLVALLERERATHLIGSLDADLDGDDIETLLAANVPHDLTARSARSLAVRVTP